MKCMRRTEAWEDETEVCVCEEGGSVNKLKDGSVERGRLNSAREVWEV